MKVGKVSPPIKLTIELVPRTAWFSNVRSMVSREDWDVLRKECYAQAWMNMNPRVDRVWLGVAGILPYYSGATITNQRCHPRS